jgi:hypothetical protein
VIPELSTSILFSFLSPSVAHRIASQSKRDDCLQKEEESLNLSIRTILSSSENHREKRFFSEVAASAAVTSPSFVKS